MSELKPCGHEPPQSSSQLHGVCIFCWRDRCGAWKQRAEKAERELADARAEIERLKAELTSANIYKSAYLEADEAMGDGPSTKNTLAGNIRALRASPQPGEVDLLQTIRDRIKFEANSDGGIVARAVYDPYIDYAIKPPEGEAGCSRPHPRKDR